MISRSGACEGFVLVFWGEACCCAGSQSHSPYLKKAPAEHRGARLGVSSSALHSVCCAAHWSLSVLMGRVKSGLGTLSLRRGAQAHCCSGNPTEEWIISPLMSQVSIRFPPSLSFCPGGGAVPPCFISNMQLGFKTPSFGDLVLSSPKLILWAGSHHVVAVTSLSQKSSRTTAPELGVYDEAHQKACIQVSCPQQVTACMLGKG